MLESLASLSCRHAAEEQNTYAPHASVDHDLALWKSTLQYLLLNCNAHACALPLGPYLLMLLLLPWIALHAHDSTCVAGNSGR